MTFSCEEERGLVSMGGATSDEPRTRCALTVAQSIEKQTFLEARCPFLLGFLVSAATRGMLALSLSLFEMRFAGEEARGLQRWSRYFSSQGQRRAHIAASREMCYGVSCAILHIANGMTRT